MENEVRLSRIHMVARFWDHIPGRRDLPPGIRFEELDQVRVSEIAPDEENGMVWERLVENWHEEHWERRTPWRGSSNFRVLRRAGPETSGSSSKVMMADKATQTLNKENKATQTDLPNDKARRFFKEFQKQTDNQG